MTNTKIMVIAFTAIISLTSCSLYQPELIQGFKLEQESINQLKVGMSMEDVNDVLGSATLRPTLDVNRMDYVFGKLKGNERDKDIDFDVLSLYFENNKLKGFSGSKIPANLPRLKIKRT